MDTSEGDEARQVSDASISRFNNCEAEHASLKETLGRMRSAADAFEAEANRFQAQSKEVRTELEEAVVRPIDLALHERARAHLLLEVSCLRSERCAQLLRMAELQDQGVSLKADNNRLRQELRQTHTNLAAIVNSPGWMAVQKYRIWLSSQKLRRPLLFRYQEKLAALWLNLLGIVDDSALKSRPTTHRQSPQIEAVPSIAGQLAVPANDPMYQQWIDENEPGPGQLREQSNTSATMANRPMFSVILPVYQVSIAVLRECIDSVLNQSYDRWELCIVDGDPTNKVNRELLRETAAKDQRVRIVLLEENQGISGNSNVAVKMAVGDFLAFLDHDDLLAPFAFFEAACLLNTKPDTDLLYSDHDYLEAESKFRYSPLFKPAWSPELMFSANYITHLTIIRRVLVKEVGGFDSLTDGAQDWDLFLRVAEKSQRIERIPKVLYHWRAHSGSTAWNSSAKDYAQGAQLLSLRRHMQRIGMPAEPEVTSDGLLHVRWNWNKKPLISIVIPSQDKVESLSRCISSLLEVTDYPSYEILIVDNHSVEPDTHAYYKCLRKTSNIRVLDFSGPFKYSAANNCGAKQAKGELVLFLNNDVKITKPEWLLELAGWALYSPIGIVGARLFRENGLMQHAGVVIGLRGYAGHAFEDHRRQTTHLSGSTDWYRNYLAVSGACMIMRKEMFDVLGGFDESFMLCGSDVDICLRSWQKGYRVVFNPFAELIHDECQTRETAVAGEDFFISYERYQPYLENGDPYWSPNLSLWSKDTAFRSNGEPSILGFVLEQFAQSRRPVNLGDLRASAHILRD